MKAAVTQLILVKQPVLIWATHKLKASQTRTMKCHFRIKTDGMEHFYVHASDTADVIKKSLTPSNYLNISFFR